MAQAVATGRLGDSSQSNGLLDRPLQPLLVGMMSAHLAAARVPRRTGGGENILPAPLPIRRRVLLAEGIREVHPPIAPGQVSFVEQLHPFHMLRQRSF